MHDNTEDLESSS